jgi:hypothetical protein
MTGSWWIAQIGRASSRLLNAILGGEGDVTFSAYSEELRLRGDTWGVLRVKFVDTFMGKGHCADSWQWHQERRLFEIEK